MEDLIIETQDLTFRYSGNDSPSLDGVSVRIRKGVRTVILGANGAGKSTTMNIMTGCLSPPPAASSSMGSRSVTGAEASGS